MKIKITKNIFLKYKSLRKKKYTRLFEAAILGGKISSLIHLLIQDD